MENKQTITEVSGDITIYGEADLGRATSSAYWSIKKIETIAGVTTVKYPIGDNRMPTTKAMFVWDDRATLNFSFEEDVAVPTLSTVTIASNNTDTAKAKVGDVVTITVVASEIIKNVVATIAGHPATIVDGADEKHKTITYTMVEGDTTGVVPFTIDFTDIGGNAGTQVTAVTGGASVTFDKTRPTALLEYSIDAGANYDSTITVKNADTLLIRATFSEIMLDAPIVKLAIDNAILVASEMTKVDTTHYTYSLNVPAGDIAIATCSLSIGTDRTGNVITAVPTSGATFGIDNTAPTMLSAILDSITQITITLSELASVSTITKANDGGFIVYDGTNPLTTYAISAIAPGATNDKVVLTVADVTASAAEGLQICYAAVGNGTVADPTGNTMITDVTGVEIAAW